LAETSAIRPSVRCRMLHQCVTYAAVMRWRQLAAIPWGHAYRVAIGAERWQCARGSCSVGPRTMCQAD
jgi:hypothetical protein